MTVTKIPNPITVAVVSALLSGLLVSVGWSFHGAQRLAAVETAQINFQAQILRELDSVHRQLSILDNKSQSMYDLLTGRRTTFP